jgi:hypothetical protein
VLIGLVLIRTSLRLGKRSHDFLTGAWLLPPRRRRGRGRRRGQVPMMTSPSRSGSPTKTRYAPSSSTTRGVTAIREVLVTFTGPGRVWVTARLDIGDGLTGAQVKTLVRGIESGMKHESEAVYRVDVVPTGVGLG